MSLLNHAYRSYFLVFLVIMLLKGCSPKRTFKTKSFFLDGVPYPEKVLDPIIIDTTLTIKTFLDNIVIVNKFKGSTHQPYSENKCSECHNPGHMGQLKMEKQELCFSCHENYGAKHTYSHGPVSSGNCTQCHNPHSSQLKSLLRSNGQELCYTCHIENKVRSYAIHINIAEENCVNCHNPHGGSGSYFLQASACYQCHDNFEEKFTYMHGPVGAGGLCTTCHESHAAKQPNLLKTTGNQLCLECHIKSDIDENKAHVNTKKQSCTSCHNPHGSSQPMLLTKIPLE